MIATGPASTLAHGRVISHVEPNDGIPSVFMRPHPPREIRDRGGRYVGRYFGIGYCLNEIARLP